MLGPGGVGGLLAAALARAGADVVVIAREPTAELIARAGIAVESAVLGDFTARPAATARLREPAGVLIVATKATGLEAALSRVEAEPALVVPLLNGLDHMALLRERFPGRVAAGAIRVESDRPAPGRIVQGSPFLAVELAARDERLHGALAGLAAALGHAGVPVRVRAREADVLWGKLARLSAIALTTSAYDLPLGEVRADPEREAVLSAALREAVAVGRAAGAVLDADKVLAEVALVHPSLTSSMQRDIRAGRESELDAIGGAVLRAAALYGLAVPTVAGLVERVLARAEAGA